MSLPASVIDALVAAGCTAEQLAAAIKAANAEAEAQLIEKRAKDAERQRKSRANRALSQNVTVTERDVTDFPLSPSPLLSPQTPQITPHPHTPVYKTPRARRLPVDWVPAPLPSPILQEVSVWKAGLLEAELAKFRDWAASAPDKTGLKKDWDATWRNWLRRRIEENSKHGTANRSNHQNGAPRDGFAAVLRDVGSREAAFAAAGDDGGLRPSAPVGLITSG